MEIIATQKFLIVSPKKLRTIVGIIKGLSPIQAVEKLPFVGKKASEPLIKVVKSAIANAKVKGISDENLVFKEIQIGDGPRLKRGRPVSRGMWHPIIKRMSHIRVVLKTKEEPKVEKAANTAKIERQKEAKASSKKVK